MKKDDILDFLDKKFAATESKKKVKKPKKKTKVDKTKTTTAQEETKTPLTDALKKEHESGVGVAITADTLYKELVPVSNKNGENAGVKALKEHHLKTPQSYETQVRDKIFLIGQNTIQGTTQEVPANMGNVFVTQSIQQQAQRAMVRSKKHKRLSKNTLKQLEKLHEIQAPALRYSTFEQMHHLWLQYISMLLQIRKDDLAKGLDLSESGVQSSICSKLVKSDFSGAKIKVIRAKNERVTGEKGLIVRETARTFLIIQPDDQVKTIAKEGTVFQLSLPAHLTSAGAGKHLAINIWGDTILYKGSERSKLKFKEKYNLSLY